VNSRRLPGECSARALYRETVRRAFNNRSNLFLALLRDKARETPLGSARLGSAWLARARVVTLRVLARFTERSVARKQCRRRLVEREREREEGEGISAISMDVDEAFFRERSPAPTAPLLLAPSTPTLNVSSGVRTIYLSSCVASIMAEIRDCLRFAAHPSVEPTPGVPQRGNRMPCTECSECSEKNFSRK
jgi:hypothetical protein